MERSTSSLGEEGFALRLRQERLRLGLTQAQAAAAGGVATQTQISYERGNRTPDANYLAAIGRSGFDVSLLLHGVAQKELISEIFDWELLARVQQALESWCSDRGISLPPDVTVEISRVLYDQFAGRLEVDSPTVDRVLRLVVNAK